jgi:hypothetical protein
MEHLINALAGKVEQFAEAVLEDQKGKRELQAESADKTIHGGLEG